jgi:hypothetical protein
MKCLIKFSTAILHIFALAGAAGDARGGEWTYDPGLRLLAHSSSNWVLRASASGSDLAIMWVDAKPKAPAPLPLDDRIADGYQLAEIGAGAFVKCEAMTSLAIPGTVTNIGSRAFSGCANLERAQLPDGIQNISDGAFSDCLRLASIEIPNSATNIGAGAFYNCAAIASIAIPGGVLRIGNSAFANCRSLRDARIAPGVAAIGDSAFSGCSVLASLHLPASVSSIGEWAFYGCANLERLTIANDSAAIGDYAFSGCDKLPNANARAALHGADPLLEAPAPASATPPRGLAELDDKIFYAIVSAIGIAALWLAWRAMKPKKTKDEWTDL